jgi:hypothetical protein
VVGQVARLVLAGLSLGLALVATRLLSHLLFGIRATDPLTYGAAVAVLTGAALVACELPRDSGRAVDPARALHANG